MRLPHIKLSDYELIYELNNYTFFWHDLYLYTPFEKGSIVNIIGAKEKNLLCICRNGNYKFYLKKKEIEENYPLALSFFCSKKYGKFVEDILKIVKDTKQIDWKYKCYDVDVRLEWLANMHANIAAYYFCTESYYTDSIVQHLLSCGYLMEDIVEFSAPVKMTTFMQEQLQWYKLVVNYKDSHNDNLLQNHLDKWKYIIAKSRTEPYTPQQLHNRLQADLTNSDTIAAFIESHEVFYTPSQLSSFTNRRKQVFGKDDRYVEILSQIAYLRFELRLCWMKTGYLINHILLLNYPENVYNFSIREILCRDMDFLCNRQSFVYFKENETEYLLYNGMENLIKLEENKHKMLTGKISFGQDVVGCAYVLPNNVPISNALSEINCETILVLSQLCPEHIPLMRICKGIVVDEGGITGHASIVAREMNKPFISGVQVGIYNIQHNSIIKLDIKGCRVIQNVKKQ